MVYTWAKIASATVFNLKNEHAGKPVRVQISGEFYCLIYKDKVIHALKDKCPHAGARLTDGWCVEGNIVCPLHRMTFNLDTGREVNGGGYGVEIFPIKEENDGVYIGLPRKWWQF